MINLIPPEFRLLFSLFFSFVFGSLLLLFSHTCIHRLEYECVCACDRERERSKLLFCVYHPPSNPYVTNERGNGKIKFINHYYCCTSFISKYRSHISPFGQRIQAIIMLRIRVDRFLWNAIGMWHVECEAPEWCQQHICGVTQCQLKRFEFYKYLTAADLWQRDRVTLECTYRTLWATRALSIQSPTNTLVQIHIHIIMLVQREIQTLQHFRNERLALGAQHLVC